MWSRSTLVIAATPPSQVLVASRRPPRPTSITPTSIAAAREPGECGGGHDLELGGRAKPARNALRDREDLLDECGRSRPHRSASRPRRCARGNSPGAALASARRTTPAALNADDTSAWTLPFPFVPPMSAPRNRCCGLPSSSSSAFVRPRPSLIPNRPRAVRAATASASFECEESQARVRSLPATAGRGAIARAAAAEGRLRRKLITGR